jgi:hypothetical protein
MATWHHCWRCKKGVPFLDEIEWAQVEPLVRKSVENVKKYREQTGTTVSEALGAHRAIAAQAKFKELTGYVEADASAIWHHRLQLYGDPCPHCGELLRTPRARYCAECGRAATASASI